MEKDNEFPDIAFWLWLCTLVALIMAALAVAFTPLDAWATDYRRDPAYGWDSRCSGPARYEAMSEGFNCNAKPGDTKSRPAWCGAYLVTADSCTALKALVWKNGLARVKASARLCGATEAQIAERESSCK